MPMKARVSKRRAVAITEAARARWLAVGPSGVRIEGTAGIILDEALADALGLPWLIWHPAVSLAVADLEGATCR